jgi:hypothetical protein
VEVKVLSILQSGELAIPALWPLLKGFFLLNYFIEKEGVLKTL